MSQRRRLARSTVRPSSSTHGSPQEDEIAFNAGTHQDAIAMRWSDFVRIVDPIVGRFAE